MKFRIFIIPSLIIILASSCRKDPAIIEQEPIIEDVYKKVSFDFNAEWTYRNFSLVGPDANIPEVDTMKYWFDGDTVLNRFMLTLGGTSSTSESRIYHKLHYHKKTYTQPGEFDEVMNQWTDVCAYIRHDSISNRLYVTYVDMDSPYKWWIMEETEECLLLDFNLEMGDTLEWNRWNHGVGNISVVSEIDSLIIGEYKLRFLKMYPEGSNSSHTIIPGVGGLEGLEYDFGTLIHYHCAEFDYIP